MSRAMKATWARVLVVGMVFTMVLTAVPTVAFAATGTITGTITGEGVPLEGVRVQAYHAVGTPTIAGDVVTDALGHYTFPGLAPDDYFITASTSEYNQAHDTDFLGTYYPQAPRMEEALPVTVPDGGTTAGIDINVRAGGSISGSVTSPDGPLPAVVQILRATDGRGVGTCQASSEGVYVCSHLWPGDYAVRFLYANGVEYYSEALTIDDASPVHVDFATDTPNIDCYLDYKGSISGAVTIGGVGVEDIRVTVRGAWTGEVWTVTGPGGGYRIDGLEPGTYTVTFNPTAYNVTHGTSYLSEYYQDDYYAAADVIVNQGAETTGVSAALEEGGRIAGTATRGGVPSLGLQVAAIDAVTGRQVWYGITAADGTYGSGPLPPGTYKVKFTGNSTFLTEYYNNAHVEADATPVPVTAGATTSGIDASLDISTLIHGYVFGDWDGLAGVRVEARSASTNALVASMMSGTDGEFTFYGLPVGTYVLKFDPTDYNTAHGTSFAQEYYGETRDLAEAETVSVLAGVTGEDVGVQLTSPQTGLSGTVTDLAGAPIEGIEVWIKDSETNELWDYTYTDTAGNYSVNDLPAGPYLVEYVPYELNQLSDELIVGEWYNDAIRRENADEVTLTHGQMTPNVNAALSVLMPVYRFYNVKTGTHFYTPSYDEAIMVIDELYETFDFEGIAYRTNPANNGQPLYRFYNRKTGSHFYTADSSEAANIMANLAHTYSYDGQTYAVNQAPVPNSIPVYRFYNVKKGSHFYTSDWAERDTVMATLGSIYRYEGPCFYLGQ